MLKYFKEFRERKQLFLRTVRERYPIIDLTPIKIEGKEEIHVKVPETDIKKIISVYEICSRGRRTNSNNYPIFPRKIIISVLVVTEYDNNNYVYTLYPIGCGVTDVEEMLKDLTLRTDERYELNGSEINPSLQSSFIIRSSLDREEIRGHVNIER